MALALLGPQLKNAAFRTISLVSGESLPSSGDCDGCIIMGSEHSVLDRFDWMLQLEAFVRELAAARRPIVGICFGHQLMASALGGQVSRKDWVVGAEDYVWSDSDAPVRTIVFHQDQVTAPPANAVAVLSSPGCRLAGFRYRDFPGFSVQSHPEFTPGYMRALVEFCRGDPLTDRLADLALASLSSPLLQDRVVDEMAAMLTT